MSSQLAASGIPPALSVCVATFNRRDLLRRLFSSGVGDAGQVEWVVVDDGSSDGTDALVDEWRHRLRIVYVRQANAGRAKALRRAVELASGHYTIIMDSDDYFTDGGLAIILREVGKLAAAAAVDVRPVVGVLLGTRLLPDGPRGERINMPRFEGRANFVAARADFGCTGDLKEVVETGVLQSAFRRADFDVRRVPTYLWWSLVSLQGDCLMVREAVAVKEYMPDGMTANIFRLKTSNAAPMAALYSLLSRARIYRSLAYRMRSKLLWYRYALLSGTVSEMPLSDRILYAPALLIHAADRLRMARPQGRRPR